MRGYLTRMKVELGKYYVGHRNKTYRCVLASPKGINFLDETTNRMLFKKSIHAGYTGKPIPRGTKQFTITMREYQSLLYETKETKS